MVFRIGNCTGIFPAGDVYKRQPQDSVSLSRGENTTLEIHGRHDPCIVPRAVPCVEAAAAIAVCDALLEQQRRSELL